MSNRAEDWNLATPLQTCSFLVERRGDTLTISFLNDDKLFCQAIIDTTKQSIQHWFEQVADSSRYFVLKIQNESGREATIGFGFRDRDEAMALRESLQHYERSISRELQAAESPTNTFSVPALGEGEQFHVDKATGKTTISKTTKSAGGGGSAVGAVPLLKKPPPSASG